MDGCARQRSPPVDQSSEACPVTIGPGPVKERVDKRPNHERLEKPLGPFEELTGKSLTRGTHNGSHGKEGGNEHVE